MSTNIVFTVPGRNHNYMPIDINASKEEILEKYARLISILICLRVYNVDTDLHFYKELFQIKNVFLKKVIP